MRGVIVPENMQALRLSSDAQNMLMELVDGTRRHKQPKAAMPDKLPEPVMADLPIMDEILTPQPLAAPFAESYTESYAEPEISLQKQKIKEVADTAPADALIDLLGQLEHPFLDEADGAMQDEKAQPSIFETAIGAIINDPDEETEEKGTAELIEEETEEADASPPAKNNLKIMRGVKHTRKAFEQQAFGSPFLKTMSLVFILLLVAALPPAVNLFYIQPIITDNNSKLSEIALLKSQTTKSTTQADKLLAQLKSTERNIRSLVTKLSQQSEFDFLYSHFLAALERHNVKIIKTNSVIDEVHSAVIDTDKTIEIKFIDLEVETRFDVYRAIREIFIKEASSVTIIEEDITASPNKADLKIHLKIEAAYLKGI